MNTKSDGVKDLPIVGRGACFGMDINIFFPTQDRPNVGGEGALKNFVASNLLAFQTCWGCPVREECLAYALEEREDFGIWGGIAARERRNAGVSAAVMIKRDNKWRSQNGFK